MWKFCGKVQFPHIFRKIARNYANYCTFPQNFHTKKLGENMVFFAVIWFNLQNYLISITSVPIICQETIIKHFLTFLKRARLSKKLSTIVAVKVLKRLIHCSSDNIGCTNTIKNVAKHNWETNCHLKMKLLRCLFLWDSLKCNLYRAYTSNLLM